MEALQSGGPVRHYSTTRWQRLRTLVLAREPLCRDCAGRGVLVSATVVDHIKPLEDGGSDELDNLQPLCKSCHDRKTMREAVAPVHRRMG